MAETFAWLEERFDEPTKFRDAFGTVEELRGGVDQSVIGELERPRHELQHTSSFSAIALYRSLKRKPCAHLAEQTEVAPDSPPATKRREVVQGEFRG